MKPNVLTAIVVVLLVAGGAYYLYLTRSGNESPLSATPASENPTRAKFQALSGQLQSISFNTEIFTNPNFLALVDISTPTNEETKGRTDPFSAIPGVSAK